MPWAFIIQYVCVDGETAQFQAQTNQQPDIHHNHCMGVMFSQGFSAAMETFCWSDAFLTAAVSFATFRKQTD